MLINLDMEEVPQSNMVRLSAKGFCAKLDGNQTLRRMAQPPGL